MPDPQVPLSAAQTQLGSDWFNNAPGGDINLDQLFPNPELASQTPPVPAPAAPQDPPAPQWFLETSTGTKYKSAEDTIRGVEEKDRVIQKLRQELAQKQGQDPLAAPRAPQEPVSYMQNPEKIFDDLVAAANKGDKRGYAQTLDRYLMERLAPYQPLLAEVANEQALRQAESKSHGVSEFVGSADFASALENFPVLKQAVEFARSTPQAQGQLGELYQLAYLARQGQRAPELVRQAVVNTPAPPVVARTTLTPSTPTPTPGPAPAAQSLASKAGRAAITQAGDARGLGSMSWSDVGL